MIHLGLTLRFSHKGNVFNFSGVHPGKYNSWKNILKINFRGSWLIQFNSNIMVNNYFLIKDLETAK